LELVLCQEFESTAEWRRQKASEHTGEKRNIEAAKILDRLAATVHEIDAATLRAYFELFNDLLDSERYSEMLRRVGFHSWPETASDFVSEFIAESTGG